MIPANSKIQLAVDEAPVNVHGDACAMIHDDPCGQNIHGDWLWTTCPHLILCTDMFYNRFRRDLNPFKQIKNLTTSRMSPFVFLILITRNLSSISAAYFPDMFLPPLSHTSWGCTRVRSNLLYTCNTIQSHAKATFCMTAKGKKKGRYSFLESMLLHISSNNLLLERLSNKGMYKDSCSHRTLNPTTLILGSQSCVASIRGSQNRPNIYWIIVIPTYQFV